MRVFIPGLMHVLFATKFSEFGKPKKRIWKDATSVSSTLLVEECARFVFEFDMEAQFVSIFSNVGF